MYLPNHTFYSRNRPVVPLPNPGEGGPVYPEPARSPRLSRCPIPTREDLSTPDPLCQLA